MKIGSSQKTILALIALLTAGLVSAWVNLRVQAERAVSSDPPATISPYNLTFSQIASSGSSGESSSYQIEDTIRVAAANAETQSSGSYSIVNPLGHQPLANNGLAIGQGTVMALHWPTSDQPIGSRGYYIYRSATGDYGTYSLVNSTPVEVPPYYDRDLEDGDYYYVVYLKTTTDLIQWTPPLFGTIDAMTSSKTWNRY
ncbi:hypothetical protein HQ520_06555 [bacterium]|nr:hypothetical protein [bacterium]